MRRFHSKIKALCFLAAASISVITPQAYAMGAAPTRGTPPTPSPTPTATATSKPSPSPTPVSTPTSKPTATPTATPTSTSGTTSVLPVATSTQELHGLDIYHNDVVSSWSGLVSGGASFIAVKATEGLSFEDPQYATNRANAKKAGLIFGAYHFIDLSEDPVTQADYFAKYVNANGGLDSGDFVMLDWETTSGSPYSAKDPETIESFLTEVKIQLGRRCVVYVDHSMVNDVLNPEFLAEYPLFLADYASTPSVPAPWKTWNFWQTSGTAKVTGLQNAGDSDLFHGSLTDLENIIKYTKI